MSNLYDLLLLHAAMNSVIICKLDCSSIFLLVAPFYLDTLTSGPGRQNITIKINNHSKCIKHRLLSLIMLHCLTMLSRRLDDANDTSNCVLVSSYVRQKNRIVGPYGHINVSFCDC